MNDEHPKNKKQIANKQESERDRDKEWKRYADGCVSQV